eukprot:6843550-Pyramimonas_sp.AAC.1
MPRICRPQARLPHEAPFQGTQNFEKTPWNWSHGDGRGHCADPDATPYEEQLTESDCDHATPDGIARSNLVWKHLSLLHCSMQFNRDWHAGKPADPK